jgi:hypothetical protein
MKTLCSATSTCTRFCITLCMGCGEKLLLHMETGDESDADNVVHYGSSWFLWQFRNFHIPKRAKAKTARPQGWSNRYLATQTLNDYAILHCSNPKSRRPNRHNHPPRSHCRRADMRRCVCEGNGCEGSAASPRQKMRRRAGS